MNGASGIFEFQVSRSGSRYRLDASTGETFATPSGPLSGRIAAVRSSPGWDSHDFAEDTSRLATSAPRFCASVPTTKSGEVSQGSAIDPAGKSDDPGRYKN